MLEPARTLSVFMTVPAPVWSPQPRGAANSNGKSSPILTTLRSLAGVGRKRRLSEKVPVHVLAIGTSATVKRGRAIRT